METSYNGWPASPDRNAIGVVPFGDAYGVPFPGGVKGGDVHTVLGYVASQLHHRVEPCVAGWDWGYHYRANVNNPSVLSCHSSGTAIDYNAPNHPNGVGGTFSSAQVGDIRRILAEVQGAVQWGGDYSGTKDEMHFEIIVNAADLATIAATLPTGTTPNPDPQPEEEDDDMYHTYQADAGPYASAIFIATPGYMEPLDSMESYEAMRTSGAAKAVTVLSQRDFDVVLHNYRSHGPMQHPITSLVSGTPTTPENSILWADKWAHDAANA